MENGTMLWQFCDWISTRLKTRKWVVAPRWTDQLRDDYEIRLSQKQYSALFSEWQNGVAP